MTVYLSNSYSLNMINLSNMGDFERLDTTRIDVELARYYLSGNSPFGGNGFTSIVGHADTARIIEGILGLPVAFNRATIALDFRHDMLIVAQYTGPRLPEGATELPEGATIAFYTIVRPEMMRY